MRKKYSLSLFRKIVLFLAVAMVLLPLCALPALGLEIPPAPRGYLADRADIISAPVEQQLERILHSLDLADSTQISVLTIDSLEGEALDDFSIRVASSWGIGQKGKDNGVLLLVAKKERKIKIEVGYGLEGVITDLLAGRIIDDVMIPEFKAGRFDEGIQAGVAAIVQASKGEFKAAPTSRRRNRQDPSPLFNYLFFGAAIIAFLGKGSKKLGVVAGALILPVLVFLGMPSIGWLLILMMIPAGALGGLLLPLLLSGFIASRMRTGGFSGGSGGSFGGFGGGGFGGGGASGGW